MAFMDTRSISSSIPLGQLLDRLRLAFRRPGSLSANHGAVSDLQSLDPREIVRPVLLCLPTFDQDLGVGPKFPRTLQLGEFLCIRPCGWIDVLRFCRFSARATR